MSDEPKDPNLNTNKKFIARMVVGTVLTIATYGGMISLTHDPQFTFAVFAAILAIVAAFSWSSGRLGYVSGMLFGPLLLGIGVCLLLFMLCVAGGFRV